MFVGFGFGSIAQGLPLVLVAVTLERRGAGAAWLAGVAVARLAPYLLCSPIAGALAGRFDPRRLFAVAGAARAAVTIALGLAIAGEAPFAVLVVLMFTVVAVGTPTYPALMRVVRTAVPAGSLDRTSAIAAGLESATFWAGPALGGVLLMAGTSASIVVGVGMSVASALVARSIGPADVTTSESCAGRYLGAAASCLFGSVVRPAFFGVMGVNALAGLVTTLLVRLPAELESGGAREYGLLSLLQGCGALVAFATLVGPVHHIRRPLVPLAAAGAAVAALAAGSVLAIAALACAAFGAAVLASEVAATSSIGRDVPAPFVAPAFGLLDAGMVAAMIAGAAVAPALVATVGLRWSLVLAGAAMPLLAAGLLHRVGRPATVPTNRPPATTGALS